MSLPLTKRVVRILEILFEEPRRADLARRLQDEAAENIPFHDNSKPADLERVRFSILKLLDEGDLNEDGIFELAKVDWRDLFMNAGFADDVSEHHKWYRDLLGEDPDERPWWVFWR